MLSVLKTKAMDRKGHFGYTRRQFPSKGEAHVRLLARTPLPVKMDGHYAWYMSRGSEPRRPQVMHPHKWSGDQPTAPGMLAAAVTGMLAPQLVGDEGLNHCAQ